MKRQKVINRLLAEHYELCMYQIPEADLRNDENAVYVRELRAGVIEEKLQNLGVKSINGVQI